LNSNAQRTSRPKLLLVGPLPPPYIGPAVATERLVRSPIIASAFDLRHLNTNDPDDADGIGRLSLHNIAQALAHGWDALKELIGWGPDILYVPIDRALLGFLRDLLFLVPAKLFGARVVIHLRAGRFDLIHDFGRLGRMVAWIGLRCASRAIVLGESVRDVFGDYIAPERIAVVPNGIDLGAWPAPPPREDDGRLHIVYLANLFHAKGAHVMLRALPLIVARFPNITVSFAGNWHDAPYRELCMRLVEEGGIAGNVAWLGVVGGDAKRALLASADVVAFTPVAPEGAPWVVLEGMASCRPVIGTPQGTMGEMIVDGVTGYLIPPDDPEALASRVIVLASDPALREGMGRAARKRVEDVYSEAVCHGRFVEAVRSA
jgi:glycosyltransferase involved in cell wall biosynthesis